MTLRKLMPIVPVVCTLLVFSGCGTEEKLTEEGDPPEVTCQRFRDTIEQFSDIDPASMGFGDILSHVSEGFNEMETIADEAQDDELAHSIDTLTATLNSSIASAGGDIEGVRAEFEERLQEPEVHDAAAYLEEVCGAEMQL